VNTAPRPALNRGVVFERDHRGGHRVERAAVGDEHIAPGLQRAPQSGMVLDRALGIHLAVPQGACAAMDGEGEATRAGFGGRRAHYGSE